uniref:Palmitoyltransferase n=1 Tax=Emiliania huxleyi TaxID=2903 RepID=A0A7S3WDB0_EMIHU
MPRGQRLLQGTWIGDLIDLIPPPILAGIAVYRIAMTIPAPKWVDAKRKEFQRDMGEYRKVAFFHCCPTIFMLVVWLLVVYNYYAIVRWSDASWPVGVMVTGYGLIALQVASFDRVMRTHPGVLPEEWRVEAHRGHAPFYICRRTGRKLPPRCFHIKSLGQDVLFLDHFCFWLNKPIGLRNRKYFLLFLGYSLLLTVLGVLLVASLLHGVYFNPHTTLRMLLPFAPVTHPSAPLVGPEERTDAAVAAAAAAAAAMANATGGQSSEVFGGAAAAAAAAAPTVRPGQPAALHRRPSRPGERAR